MCQTGPRVLTDTLGLEVVLGVGDRWTVTSAITGRRCCSGPRSPRGGQHRATGHL